VVVPVFVDAFLQITHFMKFSSCNSSPIQRGGFLDCDNDYLLVDQIICRHDMNEAAYMACRIRRLGYGVVSFGLFAENLIICALFYLTYRVCFLSSSNTSC
jgi:hypothetical protein